MPEVSPTETGFDFRMKEEAIKISEEKKQQLSSINTVNVAVKSHNPGLCESISSLFDRQNCVNLAILSKSVYSGNPLTCDSLSWSTQEKCKNEVYFHSAYIKKDRKLCSSLTDSGSKSECIEWVENLVFWSSTGNSLDDCNQYISKKIQESCLSKKSKMSDTQYLNQALNTLNGDVCKQIINAEVKSQCNDGIELLKLKESKDLSSCDFLANPWMQNQCKKTIAFTKDVNLYKKAISENDISICDDILDLSLKNTCSKVTITSSR